LASPVDARQFGGAYALVKLYEKRRLNLMKVESPIVIQTRLVALVVNVIKRATAWLSQIA